MRSSTFLASSLVLLLATVGCGDDEGTSQPTTTFNPPTTASATGTGTDTGSNGTAETDDPPSTSTATDDGVDSSSGDTPPLGPSCGHECGSAADCTVDGNDVGQDCLGGRCGVACADDNTCVAAASGWLAIPCMGDGECNGGTCVDIGGGMGGCALTPAIGACAKVALQEIQWPSIGGAMVTVCGQPNARCGDFDGTAACFIGCTAESCGEMPCGADGYCECAFDTQCVDVGLGNNCNAASRCELACQDAAECPAVGYDGGMVVCN